jgi:Uma2 family endonuclease
LFEKANIIRPKLLKHTLRIYQLMDGEYQLTQFWGKDKIQSPTFPELNLTVEQIFMTRE